MASGSDGSKKSANIKSYYAQKSTEASKRNPVKS